MSDPPVTVLMTVRDGARYLEPAVASVLGQTLRDLQVIVVDDASRDRTPEILASIRDTRVEVLRSEVPLGIARAKAYGLARAYGNYVAMMDADDIALPSRLAVQKAYLDRTPSIALVGSNVVRIDENNKPTGMRVAPNGPLATLWRLLVGPPFIHPTVMARRAILVEHPYRHEYEHTQDYDLWSRVLGTKAGANLKQPLLLYRSHPGQHTQGGREAQLVEHDLIATRVIAEQLPNLSLPAPLVGRVWRFMTGVRGDDDALDEIGAAYLQMITAFLEAHEGHNGLGEVLEDVAFDVTRRFAPHLRQRAARTVLREFAKMDPFAPFRCARAVASSTDLLIRSFRTARQPRRIGVCR